MIKFLENLRKLPLKTRRTTMWLVIIIIVCVIFFIWLLFFLPENLRLKTQPGEKRLFDELQKQLQENEGFGLEKMSSMIDQLIKQQQKELEEEKNIRSKTWPRFKIK